MERDQGQDRRTDPSALKSVPPSAVSASHSAPVPWNTAARPPGVKNARKRPAPRPPLLLSSNLREKSEEKKNQKNQLIFQIEERRKK